MKDSPLPAYIENCPISAQWVEYYGVKKFAMLNFEESQKHQKAMIDIGYCATALLINGHVEKTVPYTKRMKLLSL